MRLLVTGATGFIGGHLVRHLVSQGHHVRALARPVSKSADLVDAGVEVVMADITEPDSVRVAMEDVEIVYHLAAVRQSWGAPESIYLKVNVEGTHNLLQAAAEVGVQRFIHCSSVGVARHRGNLQADEVLPFSEPTSQVLYHRSKAQAEKLVLDSAERGRVPAMIVRPVITYGPEDESGMVTRLAMLLARGWFLPIGNGLNHIDLVYIDDLIAGMHLALERGAVGRVYILSGMAPIQTRTLIDTVCGFLGRRSPRIYVPIPLARVAGWGMEALWKAGTWMGANLNGREPLVTRDKVATLTIDRGFSHARASRELGYQPMVELEVGLRCTLDWLRETNFLPSVSSVSIGNDPRRKV
jgi:nucleoside-diphosphate-sugar epimerase